MIFKKDILVSLLFSSKTILRSSYNNLLFGEWAGHGRKIVALWCYSIHRLKKLFVIFPWLLQLLTAPVLLSEERWEHQCKSARVSSSLSTEYASQVKLSPFHYPLLDRLLIPQWGGQFLPRLLANVAAYPSLWKIPPHDACQC